jgi:O-antigen/teichoic acid export membrane protein
MRSSSLKKHTERLEAILSEIKTLLNQSSHYLAGRIISMAAGFISFPILTRVFSVNDYGILGLVTTTLFIALAISKLGFPSAIVRFYSEFKSNNLLDNFYSTFLISSFVLGAVATMMIIIIATIFGTYNTGENIITVMSVASILIFSGCVTDTVTSFLRAEQRTKLYNFILVIQRYGSLALGIFLIFYFIGGLYGFFTGQIIVGLTILCVLVFLLGKERKISLSNYSRDIMRESVKFGFPLVWSELGYLGLNYIDRYFIQFYLGSLSLGLYTAGYNLATYVTEVFMYSINYAMTPIYMNILVNKGEEETKAFFTKTFRYFILIIVPVAFGFMGVGGDLLAFLASRKYMGAKVILPYIIIGQLIHSLGNILNSGLFIKKKTRIVTIIVIGSCVLNIGANIILIPRYGILGSAVATLISYTVYTILITYYAFREFSFNIDYLHISLYVIIAIGMYFFISQMDGGSPINNLMRKIPMGAMFYSAFILIFDRDVRRAVLEVIKKSV